VRLAAYCAVVDELRRRRRRGETPLEGDNLGGGPLAVRPATGANPERVCAGRELGEAIRECMRGLARARRLAVTLYLEGHSVPEVSALLGWSNKKAENLVFRGLADLRGRLTARGIEP
jgi:RNA polymerase sigma-70 factor (ECF subfamily)